MIANMHVKKEEKNATIQINPKEIAELDRDNQLTLTEISFGKRIIERIKNLFRINDNKQK